MRTTLAELSNSEAELEMTPMIDVTFLLLIFFMCTIKFRSLEGKLGAYLPKDGQGPAPASLVEPLQLTLEVRSQGQRMQASAPESPWSGTGSFLLWDHQVRYRLGRERFDDDPAGLQALAQALAAKHREAPERGLRLTAGPGTIQADIVLALDLAAQAGLRDVSFAAP